MRRPPPGPGGPADTADTAAATGVAAEGLLPLGVLGRSHGIRGDLIFRPFNPRGVSLADLDLPLEVEVRPRAGASRTMRLVFARPYKEGDLVRFEGIGSPEAAAQLTNAELDVPRAVLPPLGDGEFYIADLVGCAAMDVAGQPRGVVRGCFWNGTQDVLEIVDSDGREVLVPAVGDFLREVDLSARRVVIEIETDDHD
jgi:16S rRNA processing protein RimM